MKVAGSLRVPGDKSISHRSLIFGALAPGRSRVTRILKSADVHSTAGVLRALGVAIPELSDDFVIDGVGRHGLEQPSADLDCGNSGTTTRLTAGVVAACPITATFVGDSSLSRRPMRRVARPLEAMGARVELPPHHGLPMTIRGGELHAIHWESEVASAQVKSAILLAAVVAGVPSRVTEPARSRDHTERMLTARGVAIAIDGTSVSVGAPFDLTRLDTAVPGDPSSAAFFAALAALAQSGEIELPGVCINETRTGFFTLLSRMGTNIHEENKRLEGGEWVADLVISPRKLRGTTLSENEVPSMVDEIPMLACVAARAEGETLITGAGELRVKESDRIAAVVANLRAIGADAEELPDGMRIHGSDKPLAGNVVTHGDHRLAMAFGILSAAGEPGAIEIDDRACVAVSYPEFWEDLARAHSP